MNHKQHMQETDTREHHPMGMSSDDLSMLNQVLQQVKGISCVSCPSYEPLEQPTSE